MPRLTITYMMITVALLGASANAKPTSGTDGKTTPTEVVHPPDYDKAVCAEFPNYRLIRTNGAEVVVCRIDSHRHTRPVVIDGNIQKLAVKTPYVTGYATVLHGNPHPTVGDGYFILNMKTGEQKTGLTEKNWQAETENLGWIGPQLAAPAQNLE